MSKKVLVLGNGGREHAIVWKLLQSKEVERIYVNEGTEGMKGDRVEFIKLIGEPFNKTCSDWCKANAIDLVVVGPEAPLVNGIADELSSVGINCFGPTKLAARIESDKSWAKEFFDRNGIATARWASFTAEGDGKEAAKKAKAFIRSVPWLALVVKASGLAFGKGVVVASTREEACEAVDTMLVDDKFGSAGRTIVVEELLQGPEVSVLGLSDGKTIRALLPAQDHKRIFDGDLGGNTGGMGAYCPCPLIDAEQLDSVCTDVLQRTVDKMCEEGTPFVGVLYAGLMLTAEGPKVLEFNCRFGDPETQVILPLLDSDLFQLMLACCRGELGQEELRWKSGLFAVGVVMASRGYPDSSSKGDVITGLPLSDGTLVFHSGIARRDADLVTNGGRVLIAVSVARDLAAAAGRATAACDRVLFDGAQFRRDIGHKGIARSMLERGGLTYKDCGVDIVAGDRLVGNIKGIVGRTSKLGVVGGIGGFGGIFDPKAAGFVDPLLVSGTDGVGTKLEVAKQAGDYSTLGQDLVAMCVNDVLCCGAKPLFFLDYLACGRLEVSVATAVVAGVAEGCRLADCALIGGETAEMPGLYADGDFDLAGFAVGAVERTKVLPRSVDIAAGDVVLGLASSGVHSNGFSLVRKVVARSGLGYGDKAPFGGGGKTLGQELVTPTRIYVEPLLAALQSGLVKAIAHITGGGLTENVPRVLPKGLGVRLDSEQWPLPPVFGWLAAIGGIGRDEMLRTFNCGLGMVMVVAAADAAKVVELVAGEDVFTVGAVEKVVGDGHLVTVTNFTATLAAAMRPHVPAAVALRSRAPRRVAVLVSGSGTNLQALMDATRDGDRDIGAEIVLVVSNKPGVMGLTRAQSAGIDTKVIPHGAYESREQFEAAIHETLVAHGVEIVCLAGFMRVLTSYLVSRWRGRLINIHPALLPLFKGVRAQRQALEAGVRVTGCTAHFVQEDVDAGAILVQEAVPIEVGDTEESLSARLLLAEHRVFPRALQLVALDKVRLSEDNTLVWQ